MDSAFVDAQSFEVPEDLVAHQALISLLIFHYYFKNY